MRGRVTISPARAYSGLSAFRYETRLTQISNVCASRAKTPNPGTVLAGEHDLRATCTSQWLARCFSQLLTLRFEVQFSVLVTDKPAGSPLDLRAKDIPLLYEAENPSASARKFQKRKTRRLIAPISWPLAVLAAHSGACLGRCSPS